MHCYKKCPFTRTQAYQKGSISGSREESLLPPPSSTPHSHPLLLPSIPPVPSQTTRDHPYPVQGSAGSSSDDRLKVDTSFRSHDSRHFLVVPPRGFFPSPSHLPGHAEGHRSSSGAASAGPGLGRGPMASPGPPRSSLRQSLGGSGGGMLGHAHGHRSPLHGLGSPMGSQRGGHGGGMGSGVSQGWAGAFSQGRYISSSSSSPDGGGADAGGRRGLGCVMRDEFRGRVGWGGQVRGREDDSDRGGRVTRARSVTISQSQSQSQPEQLEQPDNTGSPFALSPMTFDSAGDGMVAGQLQAGVYCMCVCASS